MPYEITLLKTINLQKYCQRISRTTNFLLTFGFTSKHYYRQKKLRIFSNLNARSPKKANQNLLRINLICVFIFSLLDFLFLFNLLPHPPTFPTHLIILFLFCCLYYFIQTYLDFSYLKGNI
jgi:uncharacterized membrane protein